MMRINESTHLFFFAIACCAMVLPAQLSAQGQNAIVLYDKGRKAQEAEMYQDAIDAYKSALAINPRYGNPLVGLARCYYLLDEGREALKYVQEAKKYDRNNLSLDALEGSVYAALGDYDKARGLYEYVLGKEPNNLDARFGLAELDIANGKSRQAEKKFLDALAVSPLNKTALLSLVRVCSALGEFDNAASYLELATKYYSNEPVVHFTAGAYYDSVNNAKLAGFHYRTALDLNPEYYQAALSLAILEYRQGKPADAIALARSSLESDSNAIKYKGRYLLGIFTSLAGDTTESIKHFTAAQKNKNDAEVARIALETLALSKLEETNPARRELASYHFKNGKLYEKSSLLSLALSEYRRALQIDPHYQDARLAYGQVTKLQGFPINYFFNLKLLVDYYKSKDPRVLDDYDLQMKKYNESVSHEWEAKLIEATSSDNAAVLDALGATPGGNGTTAPAKLFNQFTLRKNPFTLAVFTVASGNSLVHLDADKILVSYFKDTLSRSEKIAFKDTGIAASFPNALNIVGSRAEANKKALSEKTDYYAICTFKELDRSFEISCALYLTKTGSEIKTFSVYRTGNSDITNALSRCALDIDAALPVRGRIVLRELSTGIVDLGRMQGLKKDDTLVIVKQGGLALDNSNLTLNYETRDVIGEFKVIEVDENISSGLITKKGNYDFVNPDDEVVIASPPAEAANTH
jgi:tetratricopeptide (TPR) repeat protein